MNEGSDVKSNGGLAHVENIQLDQVNQNHIPTENEIKLIQTLNETKDLL